METMNKPSYIQAILKTKKISVAELVKKMGISRNTFYYQLNKDYPDVNFIIGFNNNTGLDLEAILIQYRTDMPKPPNGFNILHDPGYQKPQEGYIKSPEKLKDELIQNLLDQVNELKSELNKLKKKK